MNNVADLLNTHLSNINVPLAGSKVYKDECVYSFDSPVNKLFYELLYIFSCILKSFMFLSLQTPGCMYVYVPSMAWAKSTSSGTIAKLEAAFTCTWNMRKSWSVYQLE